MPAKKKLKSKTKPKRKKTRITKATTGRKTATVTRKPTKKPARRAVSKKGKPTAVIKAAPRVPAQTAPSEERIGIVTHYFNHLSVATLRLESGRLRVGDTIHFRGHTTDLTQRVESLEVNHAAVMEVGPNDDFGLRVIGHVREHDVVYKVRSQRPRE